MPTHEENAFYDIRTLQHRLRRGDLDEATVQKHIDELPDEASEGEPTRTRFTTPYADRYVRK